MINYNQIIGGLFIMAKQKKDIHKVEMTDGKRSIIQHLLSGAEN